MRIIFLREEHGNHFIKADTQEELFNACLKIVKTRYEDGEYNIDLSEDIQIPVEPVKPDNFDSLPMYMRLSFDGAFMAYRRNKREVNQELENQRSLREALVDGQAAYRFLKDMSVYPYHQFEVVEIQNHYRE